MSPLPGANWSKPYTPRIGTKVLVDFIEGDVGRPFIGAAILLKRLPLPVLVGTASEEQSQ
jgi:hypothetical protein